MRRAVVAVVAVSLLPFGAATVAEASTTRAARCHVSADGRPDKACTPGVFNPDVTQATIRSTICVPGWTRSVRPPASYTDTLKRQQIIEYGYIDTNPRHYEEDHLVPLALGGAPRDPKNLWPELGASPNPKDKDEFDLYKKVCAGSMTLDTARTAILAKWGPEQDR
jgi:hypothetical protein